MFKFYEKLGALKEELRLFNFRHFDHLSRLVKEARREMQIADSPCPHSSQTMGYWDYYQRKRRPPTFFTLVLVRRAY